MSDQKDAERYRKLRAMDWFDGPLAVVTRPKETVRPGTDCPSRERLDELLDAIPATQNAVDNARERDGDAP